MRIGVPKETAAGERRVALVPEVVRKLTAKDHEVVVEAGAAEGALLPDEQYREAGATIGDPWNADVVVKVAPPSADEITKLGSGAAMIGFLEPLTNPDGVRALAGAGVTAIAMEAIPRISRAQSMDALSSQANIGGYRSVLVAGTLLQRFYPMLMTAAGTIPPAKVLVLGAGVAGLQAIATARRLGGVVEAFDVRAAVKEQIESLGAKFVELDMGLDAEAEGGYARQLTDSEQQKQRELLADEIERQDVVITTALVPGRPAPLLVTADAVRRMKPGSVIVDLAGATGGNCELTEPGQTVVKEDVTIAAPLNLPSEMAEHASMLYARNLQSLLGLLTDEEGNLHLDFEDDIVAGACVTRDGDIVHEAPSPPPRRPPPRRPTDARHEPDHPRPGRLRRLRRHLQGAEHAAYAADVRHERDPRDRPARRPARARDGRRAGDAGQAPPRYRDHLWDDQHRRRLLRHRPHARDVQGQEGQAGRGRGGGQRVEVTTLAASFVHNPNFIEVLYIVAFGLFIYGLMGLTGPRTAVRGNRIAAVGMAIAVIATFLVEGMDEWALIFLGIVLGTAIGIPAARNVRMTAMPQMVALFNGVGGGAVALIAWVEFRSTGGFTDEALYVAVFSLFAAIVGSISFWGSNIAFGKLQEI